MNLNEFTYMLDRLWRRVVIITYGPDCQICGRRQGGSVPIDCAHIIGRAYHWVRWHIKNGVRACRKCHAHNIIMAWLEETDTRRYKWIMRVKREIHYDREIDLEKIEKDLRKVA